MRLRHIEVFHAVYRNGSISAAARELNVSQPSVSKVLRHAEDQLGYELFHRIKGGLVPTSAAHEMFVEVDDVYTRVRSLNRTARNIRSRKGGHIRLGVLPALGLRAVPQAIVRFRNDNPETSFEIDTLHSRNVKEALLEREYDIVIGYGDVPSPRLKATPLGASELLLLVPYGHPIAQRRPVDLKALHGQPFIGLKGSGPIGDLFAQRLLERGIEPEEVVIARTHYVALSLVRLGLGLSVVDDFTASLADESITACSFKDPIRCTVQAVALEDHPLPELVDDFLAALRQAFGSEAALKDGPVMLAGPA